MENRFEHLNLAITCDQYKQKAGSPKVHLQEYADTVEKDTGELFKGSTIIYFIFLIEIARDLEF